MKYFAILLFFLFASPAYAATEYFGNFSPTGASDNTGSGQVICQDFTTPSDIATLTSISEYVNAVTSPPQNVKFLVYSLSGTSGTFIGATAPVAVSTTGWATSTISVALSPSTTYCIGQLAENPTNYFWQQINTGSSHLTGGGAVTYASPGNATFGTNVSNYGIILYMGYTPASTPSFIKIPDLIFWGWW